MTFEDQMIDILVKKLEGREQEFLEAYNSGKVPEWSTLGLKEVYPEILLNLMGMSEYKLIPYLKLELLVIAARKKILERQPKVDKSRRYHAECKYYLERGEPCIICLGSEGKPNWTPKNNSVEVCL